MIELKYGRRLREAFAREGGDAAAPADRRDAERAVPVALRRERGGRARRRCSTGSAPATRSRLERLLDGYAGGVGAARPRPRRARPRRRPRRARGRRATTTDRPTVIFAYTIKGYGLEIAGRPQNHSALLDAATDRRLRARSGLDARDRVGRVRRRTRRRARCSREARRAARPRPTGPRRRRSRCRRRCRRATRPTTSTQAAFGRALLDLSRVEGVAERLVTVAPDVSTSTNLGGFINKTGVWGPDEEPVYDAMEDSPLKLARRAAAASTSRWGSRR